MREIDSISSNKPILVGVSGGSCSGKTTFAKNLAHRLIGHSVLIFQDWYYRDQSERFDFDGGSVNFDHPNAIDDQLLAQDLLTLKKDLEISAPLYDFKSHSRSKSTQVVRPTNIIILDGTLILHFPQVRDLIDLGLFLQADREIRYKRRLKRDVEERGRTHEGVDFQFHKQVEPMHQQYVEPSQAYADRVIELKEVQKELESITDYLKNSVVV